VRADDEAPPAAHSHAEEAALEPRNDLAPAQVQVQRLALIVMAPELVPTAA
jgi:hypothetical protein